MAADSAQSRLSRELFMAAFGGGRAESGGGWNQNWVTDRLTAQLEEEDLHAGQALFYEGDPPDYLYFIRNGRIRMSRPGSGAWIYEGRWVLGSFDVLLDKPRTRTAIALSDFHVMRIRSEAWIDLLEDSFPIARMAFINMSRNVAQLEETVPLSWLEQPQEALAFPLPPGRLSLVERLAVLVDAPRLRGAGVQTLADLAAIADEVIFAPGQIILESGAQRDRIFYSLEGDVLATRKNPDIERHFGPGVPVLGAACVVEPAWEARAVTRVRALTIKVEDWFDLAEEHFDIVLASLASLASDRLRIMERMADEHGDILMK
ncbi:cyclic nucleotide-binding domain-containing protein [Pendulispora rubella]|uniref:Cyclic nucleotide-binding domain-containing protein n=1 Tax=Pendulispora rubella TaxID=2741070 RepID=A0ABZ2L313_9BACT